MSNSLNVAYSFLLAWVIVVFVVFSAVAVRQITVDFNKYSTQSVCIAALVSKGIERAHIERFNQTCRVLKRDGTTG